MGKDHGRAEKWVFIVNPVAGVGFDAQVAAENYKGDKGEDVCMVAQVSVPAYLDGELHFSRRFEVSLVPAGLRVLYDPAGGHCFAPKGS